MNTLSYSNVSIRLCSQNEHCWLDNFPTVLRVTPAFRFQLIADDPDDNKFTDAAVVGNADYVVSNDRHFRGLPDIPFPKVGLLTFDEFCNRLKQESIS